jgi:hypothetical protein
VDTNFLQDDLDLLTRQPPNMRMKLAWRGGRSKGNQSVLMAAAAPRSLCAIR